jgi:hypothetical protein
MTWLFARINTVVTVTTLDANLLAFSSHCRRGKRLWSAGFSAKRRSRSYPGRLKHTRRVT